MKRFKKVVASVLALVLVVTLVPANAIKAKAEGTNTPIIAVENRSVMVGEEVTVDVTIKNNPGILGATLELSYDEKLNLTGAVAGQAFSHMTMTKPGKFSSPCRFLWEGQECGPDDIKDGVILTLTFEVKEGAVLGEAIPINISVSDGDIYDNDIKEVDVKTVGGSVTLFDFTAGDVNNDGKVNISDLILIRRYIVGGYDVDINPNAGNVNDDGKLNSADLISIRRYIAGGYGVELKLPTVFICNHTMEKNEEKEATCEEDGNIQYWYCTTCHKFFSDEFGIHAITEKDTVVPATDHTVVIIPAVEPTYDKEGSTEGSYCSKCEKTLVEPETIPVLTKDEYSITYNIVNSDPYLAGLDIKNPNPTVYTKQDGLVLEDIQVAGYEFKGWYTKPTADGEMVTELPKGTEGNKTLYARWEKIEYKVIFDSPDITVNSLTYTVDTGVSLVNPSWFGYTFVGWSNDAGFIVSEIKKGTIGNITLHANWTSDRNKAVSYSKYNAPIIIEDDNKGQFLFVYDIGRIENVPLSVTMSPTNSQGITIDQEYAVSNFVSAEQAENIAETIASATTTSSGWTLSKEWNDIYSSATETENTKIKTQERTDSEGKTVGGEYFVSNSSGGASHMSSESGGANSVSAKVTTDYSKGINQEYDKSNETYVDGKLGVTNTTEVGAGISVPVKIAKVSAEVKNTTTVSAEVAAGRKDNEAYHVDGQESIYVGTVNTSDSSSYYKNSASQSSTWNSTNGYTNSYASSTNTEISSAVSEQITEKRNYNVSKSLGETNTSSCEVNNTEGRENEYSTSFKYYEGTNTSTTRRIKLQSDASGYFRVVEAGTVHVFAVVGYDVATASYYTYTYNVLDDERHSYLDYSKDTSSFDDCENGLVTFKVPYEVNEYIVGVTGKTAGLETDLAGKVTGFETNDEAFDGTVVIPQYYSVNNGDGTYSAYKTKSFDQNTFKGNKKIKTVILPMYITEIPDNAFEGCTNLETVVAYGVTTIGDNAFKGCTSLKSFSIDNKVTSLGNNAFENVPEIKVMAANTSVADATIASGANKITLNVSKMKGSYDNKKIIISSNKEYFAFISNGITYNNLQIESNASETFISNVIFANNSDTPLKLNSQIVSLRRVEVKNASGFALILPKDNTNLKLFGEIKLDSIGENAVISKNVTLSKADAEVSGLLNLTGNYLICGTLSNDKMLTFTEGKLITISEDEFDSLLTSSVITFDPNGGSVSPTSKRVYYGQAYGTLPVPTRQYYVFEGWYTAKSGGTKVTAENKVTALVNQTLYAHWKEDTYKLTFNANGGKVSEASKTATCGKAVGTLPTPTRDYYTFKGWYTASSGGTKVTSTSVFSKDTTLYAQWTAKDETANWVKASDVPAGAKITQTKWTYVLREYKESSSSSLSGYTKYDTKRTSWGGTQGPVYSDPNNGVRNVWSERYVTSSNYKTVYHYFRYSTGYTASGGSDKSGTGYGNNYYTYDFDYQLTNAGSDGNYARGYRYYYSAATGNTVSGKYITVWACSPLTTQEWVSDNYGTRWYYQDPVYTYYYYRDVNKEATSDPTGKANVSNIVKYVKYIPK